jgi:hypothetical protein
MFGSKDSSKEEMTGGDMAKKKYTPEQLQKVRERLAILRREMKNKKNSLMVTPETKSLEVLVQELRGLEAAVQAKRIEIANCAGRGTTL